MEWLLLVVGLVVGIGIGILLSKMWMLSASESEQIKQEAVEAKSELQQYRDIVKDHMSQSAKLTEELADMNQRIIAHMEYSANILETEKREVSFPFFSKETTEAIQASLPELEEKERKLKSMSDNEQPRDYSGKPSGLLAKDTQNVTDTEKA